ncbi:MAG: hypothetical protein AB7F19_01985 [Candidatus Babeliales bacterium]
MKYLQHSLLLITLLISTTLKPQTLMSSKKTVQQTTIKLDQQNQTSSHWINVWVHGTRLTPKIFFKKFFHVTRGLHKATNLEPSYHHRAIAECLHTIDQDKFNLNNFYLFGWSGKLSFEKRKQAAQELCKELNQLITDYTLEHGVRPKVRVITHSHGGNVALNMALFAQNNELSLDELVLLACPVQEATQNLIKHSCFKAIYSLYSTRDVLQVIDPQGIYFGEYESIDFDNLFSKRQFPQHPKLKQAEIQYNNRGILHVEFLLIEKLSGFIQHLPHILCMLASHHEADQKITLQDN